MARTKITPEEWRNARIKWEAEPLLTYLAIGEMLGVSKQAVAKRAKEEGWQKSMTMEQVAAKANRLADRAEVLQFPSNIAKRPIERPEVVRNGSENEGVNQSDNQVAEASPIELLASAEDAAIEIRTQLIAKHRSEWNGARSLVYQAIKAKDGTLAKTAKAAAESLKIIQEGERKAYGLDALEPGMPGAGVTVIVQRGGNHD